MPESLQNIYLTIVLAPLIGAVIAGLFRSSVGRIGGPYRDHRRSWDFHRAVDDRFLEHDGGGGPGP